jgi:hypothetical protein
MTYLCPGLDVAINELKRQGVEWEYALHYPQRGYWGEISDGDIIYFMTHTADVGFYIPLMECLYINTEPRLWHITTIKAHTNYPIYGPKHKSSS